MKSIVPRNENEHIVKCIWDFFQKKITLCGKKSLHFNVDDFITVLILNMTLQKKHGLKRMSKRIVFVNPSAGSYICFKAILDSTALSSGNYLQCVFFFLSFFLFFCSYSFSSFHIVRCVGIMVQNVTFLYFMSR